MEPSIVTVLLVLLPTCSAAAFGIPSSWAASPSRQAVEYDPATALWFPLPDANAFLDHVFIVFEVSMIVVSEPQLVSNRPCSFDTKVP
jgi:hypothetical protein